MSDRKQSFTLHEHLHKELKQLIAVDPPNQNGKVAKNTTGLDPKSLLKLSKNDERRQNKVKVVNRLLDTLREDQTGIIKHTSNEQQSVQSDSGLLGRIHGCVGSHWELLPPVYTDPSDDNDNANSDSEMIQDFVSKDVDNAEGKLHSPSRKKSELTSSWLWSSANKDDKSQEGDSSTAAVETAATPERIYPTIRGGGLRLPGLDWNKTFRKGYTVLVWVRPTLNCTQSFIPEGAALRKQILYRFASSLHDNVVGSVGVCAILGQWQAISCTDSSGISSRTMLATTVTAYTLPNSDPMSHLYPSGKDTTQSAETDGTDGDAKEKSAHERNMEHFQQHKREQQSSSSNKGRLLEPKRQSKHSSMGSDKSSGRDKTPTSSSGGYVSAQLTLPADEWSLIGIQHTHPYLRRPELIISVNGEEIAKGELAFPVLDALVTSSDEEITGGISAMTLSGSSASPRAQNGDALGASASFLSDSERKMLKRRGILAECTLLDGAFENGVLDGNQQKLNCALSVHSLALLPVTVPNVVLAMIAERGPLGDSASGSGLSFVLGPVPTNPQNRDAIIALLAGYGYYGNGGSGSSGIGGSGHIQDKFSTPPRSIGLPMSIGITPGASLQKGSRFSRDSSAHGSEESLHGAGSWIGSEKEFDAHTFLQGLIGRAILTFHSGDSRSLGQADENNDISTRQGRIICQPSAAPSCIGGADEVPKVGIVRPINPSPHSTSARLEVTGNACYHNTTLKYIHSESNREQIQIAPSADKNSKYADYPPVSFTRAIHASNAVSCALLPLRLALPKTGGVEVNSAQQTLHAESFIHLSDLLSNQAQLLGLVIELMNECILAGGSTIRDETLQSGCIHALSNLVRRVLIRGSRLGLIGKGIISNRHVEKTGSTENVDYDHDHDASCTPAIPPAICKALIHLIDTCCGPVSLNSSSPDSHQLVSADPFRGLMRVRRTSDMALTSFFGLALDFDIVGKDLTASAAILASISARYCQVSATLLNSEGASQEEPLYGSLLRSQMNVQYFLDSIRVRFDNSVSSAKQTERYSEGERNALESIASSLSAILYTMLLSSLTSASGSSVTRGERDIGALVATMTECSLGSLCASVAITAIAKLLVKCGVLSPQCLHRSSQNIKPSYRRRDTVDLALENRLARNMLLCRFHDIVGPLLLSKSEPHYSIESATSNEEKDGNECKQTFVSCNVGVVSNTGCLLDWTHDWRLSLLTFSWLSSLAGADESLSTSRNTGYLITQAAQTSSLDGALIGKDIHYSGTENSGLIAVLSQFLVMSPSGEKDTNTAINKADTTSRRLSVFMQLIPGITSVILSPSIRRDEQKDVFIVKHQTPIAAEILKGLFSMLSLSIQSLYGNKKGGLLTSKPGSNEAAQRNRAKTLFVEAAKEYSPILLQVVSMLEEPIRACKIQSANSTAQQYASSFEQNTISNTNAPSDTIERTRTDSTADRDWVDVHADADDSSDVTSRSLTKHNGPKANGVHQPDISKCYTDLVSSQDMALHAVSRLVAQAMKYGGGEASTSVWRVIVSALSIEDTYDSETNEVTDAVKPTTNPINTSSKQTICHLVALVLSKFAKHHDKGTVRSPWNAETCAAVARLMDLVEEKKLLTNEVMQKFSIDQVRLIKSVLEIMKSGRENGGWLQVQDVQTAPADESGSVRTAVEDASTHSNYQLYNQQASANHGQKSNPKLLLPILQSCLRLMLPSVGIIRSEALVISATSAGKAPSTSVLLQQVCTELNDSITSAVSGLLFSVSRDIFMNAIATLKDSLDYHKHSSDLKAVKLCSELVLNVIEVMRQRYANERNRRDNGSYEDEEEEVERLILGQDQVPTNDSSDVDFLAFTGDASANQNSQMGFMQYKGLGASLNRCFRELNEKPSLGTRCLGLSGLKTLEAKAELVLSILEPFIANWKKAMAHDDEEQELVDLFNENQESTPSTAINQLPSSDAISRFSEARSILKQQHYHLAFDYLASRRFGRTAFTERLCWKTWMEFVDVESCNGLWERCIYDGGRDYYSKMATLPMFPQFARFIPSYLDHSPSSLSVSTPSAPDIDLKGQGITIVDITKKEVDETMMDLFDEGEEGADDGQKDYQEEDLDVLFPNHRDSQVSASANLDASERTEDGADTTNEEDAVTDKGDSPSIIPTDSMNPLEPGNFHFASSSFSFPPDSSSLVSMGQGVKLCGGMMEEYYSSCLHVKPDCSRKCIVMLTETHLILEFEDGDGIVDGENESHLNKIRDSLDDDKVQEHDQKVRMEKALRPKAMRWNISEASHIYLRRYRLRDSALEIFFIPSAGATTGGTAFLAGSRSLFIDFGAGVWGNTRRDDAANALMKRAPMQTVKQWPDKSGQFLHDELKKLTQAWTQGAISNFDYLSSLNCLSGRSYNDICQYPIFPWTLSNFTSETVPDLSDEANYRDLSKPIGALNELRLNELIDRFETFADPSIPPFMYGSHYSTSAGVVLHFLIRLHPFSTLHRQLQSGHFDVADRLFSSVQRTWEMCTGRSAAEVKELTPEFYCNPSFLRNSNELKLGTMQEGEVVNDVALPPWAKGSPEKFVEVMRLALESDVVSESLSHWVDLIFGYKQQGKHAIEAHNVFFYLTYYGSVDVASIEDEGLRLATECQIAHFGQCPMQLFYRPHAKKRDRKHRHSRQTISETLGLYDSSQRNKTLPFMGSPMSYWVHLAAPPPGPHAPLVSIRLTLSDRCLAVDAKGVYHFFRWAWKPEVEDEELEEGEEETSDEATPYDAYKDKGCFVAQRELMSFRNVPCLPYTPMSSDGARPVTVSMSKTLFSNRTLLLILSDGDGKGALAMQLVDPVKGAIKGEVIVPSAHSDYITSIDMDPIGTAAGQGGVGGELAVVGSADGSMTMWRFISSHYWPLRPRLRMMGHSGSKVHGVAVSSALGICASISSTKCCLFDVGNGSMIRAFTPPVAACKDHLGNNLLDETAIQETSFANTPAICLSVMGYVAVVCSTKLIRGAKTLDEVFSIELMTLEGVHVGSRLLEPDRGLPNKLFPSVDGRALFVCAGRGVSVCLISSIQPLSFVDEWRLTEEDDDDYNSLAQQAIHDIDFGPTISRPVVVAAGCSDGSLRLHALQGISKWSLENQRNVVTSAVGSVLALPAQTVKNAIGGVAGFGSRFVGFGKEIGKEAFQSVKERDGPMGFFRKK